MRSVWKAALGSFAAVFALGFALGTLRVLAVEPWLGAWAATLLELPLMLTGSWWICRWTLIRWRVSRTLSRRAAVGAIALVLLMLAEFVLGTTLVRRNLASQLAAMTSGPGALGILAQILFATFPVLQLATEPT